MTIEKSQVKGTTVLTKGAKGRRNCTPICNPKEHCLDERQKYGSQLYPVCPALKEFISKDKLYNLPDISNVEPPTLQSVKKILAVCGALIELRPSQGVIAWCAHRDNFLSEWLEAIRDDLESLPVRLEKNFRDTSKNCRELFDELKLGELRYSYHCNSLIYLLPPNIKQPNIKQPNWAHFLAWRQGQITLAITKEMSEVITMNRLTCTYPAEAIKVVRKIHQTLTPLVTILSATGDKDKATQQPAETGQNREAGEEGGAAEGPTAIRLKDFLCHHCEVQGLNVDSKKRYIQRIAAAKRIKLPNPVNSQGRKNGQASLYNRRQLLKSWPLCCREDANIPKLKSGQKPR